MNSDENRISVRRLKTFLENLKNIFAQKDHVHTTVNGHTVESNVPINAKFLDYKVIKQSDYDSLQKRGTNIIYFINGE